MKKSTKKDWITKLKPSIWTEHPIAIDSYDHIHPYGTKDDNSKNIDYVDELISIFGQDMRYLDLGCSGGGFVSQFVKDRGVFAVGIEGSDYSKNIGRAEWSVIPEYLFTADITKPFVVLDNNIKPEMSPISFDVISAFDVLEHIKKEDLPQLFTNIDNHLKQTGILVLGIATIECGPWHPTVKNEEWWLSCLRYYGYEPTIDLVNFGRETMGLWGTFKRITNNKDIGRLK